MRARNSLPRSLLPPLPSVEQIQVDFPFVQIDQPSDCVLMYISGRLAGWHTHKVSPVTQSRLLHVKRKWNVKNAASNRAVKKRGLPRPDLSTA